MTTKTYTVRSAWTLDLPAPATQAAEGRAALRSRDAGRYGLVLTAASDRGAFRSTSPEAAR